tara:strand:+ start:26553 stop:26762 length:210 start_codon:yes stop_codon:yes gene_type:complete
MTYFSWTTTKKTNNEFVATITKVIPTKEANELGRYLKTELVKKETFTTRARAITFAKKYKRFATQELNK